MSLMKTKEVQVCTDELRLLSEGVSECVYVCMFVHTYPLFLVSLLHGTPSLSSVLICTVVLSQACMNTACVVVL
ncbi:hypothetical protein ACRRTK_020891 [Alexandromys fortis]